MKTATDIFLAEKGRDANVNDVNDIAILAGIQIGLKHASQFKADGRGKDVIVIEKWKFAEIEDVLRMTSNIHKSKTKETAFDRSVIKAYEFCTEALSSPLKPISESKGETVPNAKTARDIIRDQRNNPEPWETKKIVSDFVLSHEPEYLQRSDIKSEGYWYTSKNGFHSVNIEVLMEDLVDFISSLRSSEPETNKTK